MLLVSVWEKYKISWAAPQVNWKRNAPDVALRETMSVNMQKEKFMFKKNNKQSLISLLGQRHKDEQTSVKQTTEGADTLIIVSSAVDGARNSECVMIVGEDTDRDFDFVTKLVKPILFTQTRKGQTNQCFLQS